MSALPLTARAQRDAVLAGECSARELTAAALERIDDADGEVAAFLEVRSSDALEQAEAIDQRRSAGEPLGPLAGVPVAIKDNICVRDWRVSCGSRMLENYVSPYDAHVIEKLKRADAVLIGRTNLDEFAMGSTCESSAFRVTANPWNLDCTPGGSSGGSAAAVAAGFTPLALGSDTGGSIRQPASFCGVVGLKPTYGRVSRYGLVAYASSLDQIGPFAHDVTDATLLFSAIAGHDKRDSTSVAAPAPDWEDELDTPLAGLRIGVPPEFFAAGLDGEVAAALRSAQEVYRGLGATIVETPLPHTRYGVAAYYLIAPCEASSNLARYDGVHYGHRAKAFSNLADMYANSRGEGFGAEVKRRIMIGAYALSSGYYDAYYLKALRARRLIAGDYAAAFEQVDVLLGPVAPTPAFRRGAHAHDPLQMYLQDIYTIGANLAGLPGIALPCGFSSSGLPIGMQLLGPAFAEDRLLRIARMYEQATDWKTRRSPVAMRVER